VPPGVEFLPDVVYGKAGERELRLDIARPEKPPAGKMPVLVYIHGGGWRGGSRKTGANFPFAVRGYFCASIEYRLSGEATWPAQVHDCKAALRWLRANAEKYHLDTDRIGVWGHSAGGHLAALIGTSGDVPELEGKSGSPGFSTRVAAVVDCFGPTDFLAMIDQPSRVDRHGAGCPEALLLGKPLREVPDLVRQANPITYVDAKDPPFLILHGDHDDVVPINQSELLHAALQKAGVPSTFRSVKGAGHGGPGFETPEVRGWISDFFDRQLRK
jgi:acetyl esterase/lipase